MKALSFARCRGVAPIVIVVLACLPMARAAFAQEAEAVDLVLTDVHVVDVIEGRILAGRSVWIAKGRIVAVREEAAGASVPTAARTIDGEGRYLIPGLWDSHVHFRGGSELVPANRALLPLYVANGVTSVRDAGGDITDAVLEWREAIRAGDEVGPRILTSGPKLDGPRPAWPGSIELAAPDEVPAALDSLEKMGVDYVKVYDGSLSAEVFLSIVDEAERRGLKVMGHLPLSASFLEAVAFGFDAPDHLYAVFKAGSADADSITRQMAGGELGFWPAITRAMERRDPEREREVHRAMAAAGMAVVPTLHISRVLAWVDEEDHAKDPELAYVDAAIEATYEGRVRSARRGSPESRARTRELQAAMGALVPRLAEAGVTVLAGSDAGPFNSYVYPGFALHSELSALVEAGLSPAEALRAATSHPATFFGRGEELGRVAEGYLADLVLLRADPLEDIRHTRTVDAVVLRGELVLDREGLDRLLESVRR